MSYFNQFKAGNLVLPAELLFHCKEIFPSKDDFLVWQFFFYQTTSNYEELTPSAIADAIGATVTEVNQSISSLQESGLLEFKTIELDGEIEMIFDALPALEKLDQLVGGLGKTTDTLATNDIKELVKSFEQELGRLLSPFEIEDLEKTVKEDGTSPDLVRAALREAVFNDKRHWRYIQSILKNWRREGITTISQVEAKNAEFEARKNPKPQDLKDYRGAMGLWKD